jgi:redox-sensitive bicupin YhaK (pirin superfamily)
VIVVRPSAERGHVDHGWLDTRHTFSFADYHHPAWMGFRTLRVLNEDRVQPGRGFPTHAHRDMEIVSYVLEGALEHRDSLGNGSVIRPGDVQRMTAGTGVRHSEYNPSATEAVHFLQVWIIPARTGLPPGYEQKTFPEADRRGRLLVVASPDGRDGSVTIHQDATIHACLLEPDGTLVYRPAPGRHAWLQVARGGVRLNDRTLAQGDGAAASDERRLAIEAAGSAEILLFDLA